MRIAYTATKHVLALRLRPRERLTGRVVVRAARRAGLAQGRGFWACPIIVRPDGSPATNDWWLLRRTGRGRTAASHVVATLEVRTL